MMRHGLPPVCPRCHQLDSVQRVRGLVSSRNDPAAEQMRAPQPPPPPARPGINPWLFWAFCWFCVALIVVAIGGRGDRSGSTPLFGWLVALGVPTAYCVYRFWGTYRRRLKYQFKVENHQQAQVEYGEALQIWDQLEFCHRCNSIFLPGNEWQGEVNPNEEPINPSNAWWWSWRLSWHRRTKNSPVIMQLSAERHAGG